MTETTIKERPILMHARSVNGVLARRKTQTRRIVNPQPYDCPDGYGVIWRGGKKLQRAGYGADYVHTNADQVVKIIAEVGPYGKPGDRLWVRETWATAKKYDGLPPREIPDDAPVWYGADNYHKDRRLAAGRTRASIHMPRWACRLVLEVIGVRVERVQDITIGDMIAEGCELPAEVTRIANIETAKVWPCPEYAKIWSRLWNDTNGKGAWERNDWCRVVEFKVAE